VYEQYIQIQIEISDDSLEFVAVRDLDTGEEISKADAADALEALVSDRTEESVAARLRERAAWLRSLDA